MEMQSINWVSIIGAAAAMCSMLSFAPQAWKVVASRDVRGLSAKTYGLTVGAFALWLSYGLARGDWALIVPNLACLLLSAFSMAMIIMPRPVRNATADAIEDVVGVDRQP